MFLDRCLLRLTLDVEDVNEGEPLIFALMVENQLMRREWKKRKVDGMNYKDKKQLGKDRASKTISFTNLVLRT